MAKGRRFGPRWNAGSIAHTRGPHLGYLFPRPISRPSRKTIAQAAQNTSLASRKKKGIKPSLASVTLEQSTAQERSMLRALEAQSHGSEPSKEQRLMLAAQNHVGGTANKIILEQNGYALIWVHVKGKPRTVCVNMETEKVEWVE